MPATTAAKEWTLSPRQLFVTGKRSIRAQFCARPAPSWRRGVYVGHLLRDGFRRRRTHIAEVIDVYTRAAPGRDGLDCRRVAVRPTVVDVPQQFARLILRVSVQISKSTNLVGQNVVG